MSVSPLTTVCVHLFCLLLSVCCCLQVHFKVDAPADPTQPINLAARLVLDRVVGLDEKASLHVPAAYLTERHGSSTAGQIAQGHTADGVMHAAEESGAAQQYDQQHSSAVAAAKQQHRVPAKRPHAGTAAAAVADDADDDEASAKHACGPTRVRQQPAAAAAGMQQGRQHLQQLWGSMRLQQNSSVQNAAPAAAAGVPATSHSIWGAFAPGQQQQANDAAAPSNIRQECSASGSLPVPDTSIAARYNRMLKSGGSSLPSGTDPGSSMQQQQQLSGASEAGVAAVAASADDASGLQVTPEPSRQQQQHDKKQQQASQQQQQHEPVQQLLKSSGCEEPQQEQLFAAGASNIASLFDMLAEDLACEEEQQQHQQAKQQQQQQQVGQLQHAPATTALQAAAWMQPPAALGLVAAAAAAAAHPSASRVKAPDAGKQQATPQPLSSVFEAAVLQKHKACLSLVSQPSSSTSSGTVAQHSTTVVRPNNVLRSQPLGMRSQPIGLGLGSMSAATSSTSTAELLSQHHSRQTSLSQQQQQQVMRQRQLQQAHRMPAAAAAAAAATEDEYAEGFDSLKAAAAEGGAYGCDGGELVTPPRQLLRSGAGENTGQLADGPAEAAGSSMRQCSVGSSTAHWSMAQRQRLRKTGDGWQEDSGGCVAANAAYAAQYEEANVEQDAPAPNLQQFAFGAGGWGGVLRDNLVHAGVEANRLEWCGTTSRHRQVCVGPHARKTMTCKSPHSASDHPGRMWGEC
jgi:hypothetical protein